jgi:hypothetical protein
MPVLENLKEYAERATGLRRPGRRKARELVRARKPHTVRFKDDGLVPNHPLSASEEFLVIGAYPPAGTYDECTTVEDRSRSLKTIPEVALPRKDPVYGAGGPLMKLWKMAK